MTQDAGVHAMAVVGHRDQHIRAGRQFADIHRVVRGDRDRLGTDGQRAAIGHRVARIECQVEHRGLQQAWIGAEHQARLADERDEPDRRVERAAQQLGPVAEERLHRQWLGHQGLLARESQ